MLHGFFDVGVGGELVVEVDEEDVEALAGGDDGVEAVFVEAVGFADEAFDAVALDGSLEAAFGDADGEAGGWFLGGAGVETEYDTKGEGDETAAGGEEGLEGVAAVDSFFAGKSVCGLCVHNGGKVIKKLAAVCARGALTRRADGKLMLFRFVFFVVGLDELFEGHGHGGCFFGGRLDVDT